MAVDDALLERLREHIGEEHVHDRGEVTALLIRRYARAIGDDNPLHHDREHARSLGHADIVAPPNLVPGIIVWDQGAPDEDLREDGTPAAEIPGLPRSGVRLMGGGEEMEFHRPVVAGTHVIERSTLEEVERKETRSGLMAIARYRNRFEDADGQPLLTCRRTVLLR